MVTGSFLASLGLFVLASGGVTTGGTAGLSLLLAHAVGWPFAATFLVVSLPFVALAIRGKGWAFTLRSAAALAMVSLFSAVQPQLLGADRPSTRCTRPSSATCWPGSASSWSSGTARAWAGSTWSRCCARSDWAGGPATCRWVSTSWWCSRSPP